MNKRLVVVLLGFGLLLGGCSSAPSEVSPEQKRNNFDKCVLDYLARSSFDPQNRDSIVPYAEEACRGELE